VNHQNFKTSYVREAVREPPSTHHHAAVVGSDGYAPEPETPGSDDPANKRGTKPITHHTSTATISSLTAEVRVLTIGNKQVTLSVAKQLDVLRPEYGDSTSDISPFGRIPDGDEDYRGRRLHRASVTPTRPGLK
jgi:hypothetical protein